MPLYICLTYFFWSSQVHKIQFTLLCWVFFYIFLENMNNEQRMTSRRTLVHSSKGNFSVLRSTIHRFEHLIWTWHRNFSTILDKNSPLFVLFDLKPSLRCYVNLVITIKQVKKLLVVNLYVWTFYNKFQILIALAYCLKKPLDCPRN